MKYIKNLEEHVESILQEGIADDVAELLGIDKNEAEQRISGLNFANYLELGNAVDIEDEETAREILGVVSPAVEEGVLEEAPQPGQQLEIGSMVTSSRGEQGEVVKFMDKSYLGMRAAKVKTYGSGGDPSYFYIPVDDENKVHPLREDDTECDLKLLDKPTMSVREIADKHDVPMADIASQLAMGIKVELEHTDDRKIAKEIALDHLMELPDYYDRLAKAERDPVEEGIPASTMYKLVRKSDNVIVDQGSKAKMQKLRKAGNGEFYVGISGKKNVGDKFKESIEEAKAGSFKSPMIGSRVKVIHSKDSFDRPVEPGSEGTVIRASREHTFSRMRPFVIVYTVELDNGSKIDIRREGVRKVKAVEEADNPYQPVTPPSGNVVPGQEGDDEGTLGRKEVDDLMPGDPIEVVDIDGDPTAVKVKNPNAPGDTIVVQTDKGEEHIVKKKAVSGTPKMEELQAAFEAALGEKGKWTRIKNTNKLGSKIKRAERVDKKKKLDHVEEGATKDMLWDAAEEMDRDAFVGIYGEGWGEFWDTVHDVPVYGDYKEIDEVAPPGQEDWIKARKPEFKKRYGDRWEEVLYATAWKRHNNESIEEAGFDLDPPSKHLDDKPYHNPADDAFGARQAMIALVNTMENGLGVDRRKFKKSNKETTIGRRLHLDFGAALAAAGKDAAHLDKDEVVAKVEQAMHRAGINVQRVIVKDASVTVLASKDRPEGWVGITEAADKVKPINKMGYAPKAGSWKRRMHKAQPPENHEKTKKRHKKLREEGDEVWTDGTLRIKRIDDKSLGDRVRYVRFVIGPLETLSREDRDFQVSQALKGIKKGNRELQRELKDALSSWAYEELPVEEDPSAIVYIPVRNKVLDEDWMEDMKAEAAMTAEFNEREWGPLGFKRHSNWPGGESFVAPRDARKAVLDKFKKEGWKKTAPEGGLSWWKHPTENMMSVYEPKPGTITSMVIPSYMVDEARNATNTEHSGAKKGKGGYYGRKKDAKSDSNKKRRANDKAAVSETARLKQLAGIKETASAGATGAGAVATGPAAVGGMVSRDPSIYGKTAEKPKRKKRTKEEKGDGIGRSRKE